MFPRPAFLCACASRAPLARRSTKATRSTKQHSLQAPHVFLWRLQARDRAARGNRSSWACLQISALLHERPKHLHSATMCSAVHQPFEDGDDTSCGPACIVAFNAKIQADYDESLAWLEVDEEPRTRAGATLPKSPWMPSLSCGVSSRATDGIQNSSSQASSRCWKPAGTV